VRGLLPQVSSQPFETGSNHLYRQTLIGYTANAPSLISNVDATIATNLAFHGVDDVSGSEALAIPLR